MGQAYDKEGNPIGMPVMGEDFDDVYRQLMQQTLTDKIHEIQMKVLTKDQLKELSRDDLTEEEAKKLLSNYISKNRIIK